MKRVLIYFLLLYSQLSFAQVFQVDTLLWSGPSDNRINLVVLGDGYLDSELDLFFSDAQAFNEKLFQESPYKEYASFFNVVTIKVPSNESGASHPGTATDVTEPSHPVSMVDNYFGSAFDAYGIHRLLVADNTFEIGNVLASNFPLYDQVFMLVNSPFYGGSGGGIPLASLNSQSSEIAIHELGHSFARLSDEYYAGDVFASETKNMTRESNPDLVRWKKWLGDNDIGIHQHCCGGNSSSWHKPNQNCKMERLGNDFCSVCMEGTVETIYSFVSFIDKYFPANPGVMDLSSSAEFMMELVEPDPNTLVIEWKLNDDLLLTDTTSLTLSNDDLVSGINLLQATVLDTTDFIRVGEGEVQISETILWEINGTPSSIASVSQSKNKLLLYPIPFDDQLNFNLETELEQSYSISIIDINGSQVLNIDYDTQVKSDLLDLEYLAGGAYTFKVEFPNGVVLSKVILKN